MRTFLVQGVGACVKLSPDTTSHQLCTTVHVQVEVIALSSALIS